MLSVKTHVNNKILTAPLLGSEDLNFQLILTIENEFSIFAHNTFLLDLMISFKRKEYVVDFIEF